MHTCIILYTYNIPLSSAGTKTLIQVEDVGSCLPPPHFNQLKICLPLSQYCAEFSSLQAPSRICMLLFLVSKSCPTVCYPMDYSPPGFSVHGISQARILEWVASSLSRGSSAHLSASSVINARSVCFQLLTYVEANPRNHVSLSINISMCIS